LVTNPICGDQVQVEVAVDGERIHDVSSRARGCSIAVGSGSVMTEVVRGRSRPEARARGRACAVVRGEPAAAGSDRRPQAFGRAAALPSRR
jgi:nitrogen fixation NifU-like protein